MLPFPEYRPDVSDLNGQHTVTINNVLPRGDGYGPIRALGALTQPLAAGNDSSTKVLLHFDGSDAGTTITDSNAGGSAHTWTAAGNANTDTAQSKWGGTSLACDGTGDWVTTSDHADFTLGSGDWTVDFWFRCTAASGTVEHLCGQCDSTPNNSSVSFRIGRTAADVIAAIACVSTSAFTVTGTTTYTDASNTGWHHCAFVRSGDNLKLFLDGVQEGGDVAISGTVNDSSNALRVGAAGEVTGDPWTGWIEEFRLSSTARWTADFTAPQKPYAAASSGVCRGYFRARNTDGTIAVFAGTETDLFKLNNTTLDWELVSKSFTAYSAVPSTDQWQFEQFGTSVLATQANVSAVQEYTLGTDAAFGDLSGSPPTARYIAVVGRHLVLTGLTSNPTRVHWSDLDAITTWTAGTGFANYVDLPDGGVVRGVAGGEFGLVFQESALRRLNYIPGAKPAFQIERISDELGLLGPYSIIRASGRIFFYSSKGFYSYSTVEGLRPIGKERVDRTVAAELDSGSLRLLIGAPDPQGTRVFWGYKTLSNSASTFNKLLCFDFGIGENGRWTPGDVEGEYLAWIIAPGITLDALDSVSGSLDALTFSLDSVASSLSASISAFNTDHELALFDGANLEAVLETAEQGGTQRIFVKGFTPLTDASDAMGSVKHRSTQQAAAMTTTETAINANGVCPARIDTRYARARLRIPSGSSWTFATGVEPEFEVTGSR